MLLHLKGPNIEITVSLNMFECDHVSSFRCVFIPAHVPLTDVFVENELKKNHLTATHDTLTSFYLQFEKMRFPQKPLSLQHTSCIIIQNFFIVRFFFSQTESCCDGQRLTDGKSIVILCWCIPRL